MKKPTKILTYGTFDLFHIGHVNLLKRLSELGDELIVGLSTDNFNRIKGKQTIMPYLHRYEILASCRYVTKVFPEDSWDQKKGDIERESIDIFAMGDDWLGKFDDLQTSCKVIYLPRTKDISTTEIKQLVRLLKDEKKTELGNLLDRAKMILTEI